MSHIVQAMLNAVELAEYLTFLGFTGVPQGTNTYLFVGNLSTPTGEKRFEVTLNTLFGAYSVKQGEEWLCENNPGSVDKFMNLMSEKVGPYNRIA